MIAAEFVVFEFFFGTSWKKRRTVLFTTTERSSLISTSPKIAPTKSFAHGAAASRSKGVPGTSGRRSFSKTAMAAFASSMSSGRLSGRGGRPD